MQALTQSDCGACLCPSSILAWQPLGCMLCSRGGQERAGHVGHCSSDQFTGSSGLQGIALAVGIMSTSHMEVVWAMLEHLGHTSFLRSSFMSPDSQVERVNGDGGGGLESITCLL